MKFKPTKEQIEATKIGTHIALSANAGSGKTKVLTERYLKIILEEIENNPNIIRQIVAITFTEKAASEMLERVVKQVDELFEEYMKKVENAENENQKKKFRQIKRKLSYAKIMTIHSFCLQILRDYAIDAGLEPNFKTLSTVESHLIKQEAISNALAKILNEDSLNENSFDKKNEDYKEILFTHYSPKEIKKIIKLLLQKSDIFETVSEIYKDEKKYFNDIFETVKNIFPDFIDVLKNSLDNIDENIFEKLWTEKGTPNGKNIAENLQNQIFSDYENLKNEFKNPQNNFLQFDIFTKNLIELCSLKADGLNFYIAKLFKKTNSENIFELNFNGKIEILNASEYRKKLVEILNATTVNEILLQFNLAKIILEIAEITSEEIKKQKLKLNGIDFDDMLQITRKLLIENPEIAKNISSEFSNIMVDEFQDTNNSQYEIIKSLVPSLNFSQENSEKNSSKESLKLFIVGDEKQSIYRFRNADVEVFQQAKNEIIKSNEKFFKNELQKNELQKSGNLNLTATFRMLPAITAWTNKVCGNVFSEFYNSKNCDENNISKIEYSDLVCGRNSKYYLEKIQQNTELSSDFGSIKFLLTVNKNISNEINSDEKNNFDDTVEEENPTPQESELIANYINFIVNGDSKNCQIQKEIDGKIVGIKPEYSDIAILFRSRTKLFHLVLELIKKKIPFSLASGSNFFTEQIIYDLTSYLRFLNNPQDNLALLGVMLSPFFGLNYVDVLNIFTDSFNENKQLESNKSLWKKVQLFCSSNDFNNENFANEKILFLRNELEKQIEISQTVTITHLLRTLLNSGVWMSDLIENPAKNHILQNVEKFISLAREFQNRGFSNLNDFVKELEILSEISTNNETTEQKNENAVTLQTIHSSKGLEFPIVILYNTSSGINPIKLPIISKKFGVVFDSPKIFEADILKERGKTLPCILASENEMKLETAENIRLLYVALTRAKDHLIISANIKETKNGFSIKENSFFGQIFQSLNFDDETVKELIFSDEKKIKKSLNCELKLLNDETVIKNISLNIELINAVYNTVNENKITKNISENFLKTKNIIIDNSLEFSEKNKFFSFSKLNQRKKIQENNKFEKENFIKSVLGFQNFDLNFSDENNFNNSTITVVNTDLTGSEKGTVFHNILQKINSWYDFSTDSFNELFLTNLIDEEIIDLKIEQEIDKKIFLEQFKNIIKTKLIQQYKSNLKNAIFEKKLQIPIGENFYSGIIDLMVKDENGDFEIWDWKTNKVENSTTVSILAENYKLQMQMYVYFLMHLFPNQKQYKARLLFAELATVAAENSDWTVEFNFTVADKKMIYSEIENCILRATVGVEIR